MRRERKNADFDSFRPGISDMKPATSASARVEGPAEGTTEEFAYALASLEIRHYVPLTSKKDTEADMNATTLAPPMSTSTAFPTAAVESCLRDELIEAIKAEASVKGISLPGAAAQIAKAAVSVDSLIVVSILCAVEPVVGFELPESVVRTGGYSSVEGALAHLLPRIEAQWNKRKGPKS
jgi:hypothetical protein